MRKYARLFELSQSAKDEFEKEIGAVFTPLGMHDSELKKNFLDFVGVWRLGGDEVTMGTLVEDNGGKTYIVIADREPDYGEWAVVEYRYEPKKGHELADWLFYIEDLVKAYNVPRTLIGGMGDAN